MRWLAARCLASPRTTLGLVALLTLLVGSGVLRLELRTDGELLLPDANAVVLQDAVDRERFRDARQLLVVVSARDATASLASPEGFAYLRELHRALRKLSVLQPDRIVSLASWPRLSQTGSGLHVGTLADPLSEGETFAERLAQVQAEPLASGLLLAGDGRRSLLALPISRAVSLPEAVRVIEGFCERESTPAFELLAGGPVVAETVLGRRVLRDLAVLIPLMLGTIALLLFAMQGNTGGVLVPLCETLLVLVWTFGAMGWAGVPVALVTTILPVVLMAMCITDEIHLLQSLARQRDEGGSETDRIAAAVSDVARPIVLTSLTTATGFLSFATASIAPLRHFGVFAAFGILLAMMLSFSAIPALIAVLPRGWFAARRRADTRIARVAGAPALALARHPAAGFSVAILVLALLLPGLTHLRVGDSWVENFDPEDSLVRAERAINDSFWGSYRLDVVLEGDLEYFRSPRGVALIERIAHRLEQAPHVGGVESALGPLATLAQVVGAAERPAAMSPGRLADLFILAEMSPGGVQFDRWLSPRADAARLRLYVESPDYTRARALERYVESEVLALIGSEPVRLHASGDLPVASELVDAIVANQLRSIATAVVLVVLVLVLASRRLGAALAVVPVLAATTALFGAMGLGGLELGIATSMFASLAVGVGVDFGIHFLHRFEQAGDGIARGEAVVIAARRAGPALFWNAAVLSAGFCVLLVSSLKPNHSLGMLLSGSILACYSACLLLLPCLLRIGRKPLRVGVRAGAGVAVAALLVQPLVARAERQVCDRREQPAARALMQGIEQQRRGTPRIVRMHAHTDLAAQRAKSEYRLDSPSPKTIWGIFDGDVERTQILFVFSGPGRMAGTALLIRDFAAADIVDSTWFYLRAFDHFQKLEGAVERTLVPGTALSYEDARGYVSTSLYRFRFDGAPARPGAALRSLIACPTTHRISERLGYGSLAIEVDVERRVIQHIEYRGQGGAPLKTYRVVESGMAGGVHYPVRVELVHLRDNYRNDIELEHWLPAPPLADSLYRPSLESVSFLDRLRDALVSNGLGDRFDDELAAADAVVRAYDLKFAVGGGDGGGGEASSNLDSDASESRDAGADRVAP